MKLTSALCLYLAILGEQFTAEATMIAARDRTFYLFGGKRRWKAEEWVASDDSVRGGISRSSLTPSSQDGGKTALFSGHLDSTTLGGAGFTSQRNVDNAAGSPWDLSAFDGIRLRLKKPDEDAGTFCDPFNYTFSLKDVIPPQLPGGGENSTLTWEAGFRCAGSSQGGEERGKKFDDVFLPWADFKPTFRGREQQGVEPLDLTSIKRVSLLMRSFFGQQDGDFRLTIKSIAAIKKGDDDEDEDDDEGEEYETRKRVAAPVQEQKPGWFKRLFFW